MSEIWRGALPCRSSPGFCYLCISFLIKMFKSDLSYFNKFYLRLSLSKGKSLDLFPIVQVQWPKISSFRSKTIAKNGKLSMSELSKLAICIK